MSDELHPLGDVVRAYLATHAADSARAQEHDAAVQVSAAEVDLAVALCRAGVEDWVQQEKIGPYYVDFLFDRRFAVEVDGSAYHADSERERKRDRYLLGHGVRLVWHFPALEILLDEDGVVRKIVAERERLRAEVRPQLRPHSYTPGPVLKREARRLAGRLLPAPTDEEKADAIRILRNGPWFADDPSSDPLYVAAERIFHEAGQ